MNKTFMIEIEYDESENKLLDIQECIRELIDKQIIGEYSLDIRELYDK